MKHYYANITVPNDGYNEFSYIVKLRNKCRFELNECQFTIFKAEFDEMYESDFFKIDLLTEKDNKSAKNIMNRAVELLVYITQIPYELDYIEEDSNISIDPININMSKNKILKIHEINTQYKSIRGKRKLLENVLKLHSLALKYDVWFDDVEESFFALFRVVEKIVKDEFDIEKKNIDRGRNEVQKNIKRIAQKSYGTNLRSEKLDELAGKVSKIMFDDIFSDTYPQITWFCNKKNINYDDAILAKAVTARNKLAHGEQIHIDRWSDIYDLMLKLSRCCIHEKFFNNVKSCSLDIDIKSI